MRGLGFSIFCLCCLFACWMWPAGSKVCCSCCPSISYMPNVASFCSKTQRVETDTKKVVRSVQRLLLRAAQPKQAAASAYTLGSESCKNILRPLFVMRSIWSSKLATMTEIYSFAFLLKHLRKCRMLIHTQKVKYFDEIWEDYAYIRFLGLQSWLTLY